MTGFNNRIKVLESPSQSPDLNPIEVLWCDLKETKLSDVVKKKSNSARKSWSDGVFTITPQ